MAANDPKVREEIARIGGLVTSQRTNMHDLGRRGVDAKRAKLFAQTDPSLPESERHRLAGLAFREQLARARLARSKRR